MKARTAAGLVGLILLSAAAPAAAQPAANAPAGKTFKMLIGFGVGGGYDLWARAVAAHMGSHLPGNPTVVPFGVTHAPFRPILHNAAFLGDFVPVFDIREKFGPSDMLVNRKERGTELARVLSTHTTALMRGHGDVVVGSNIQNVVWRAYYTEINARMLAQAIAIGGGPIMYLSAEEAALTDVSMQRVEARPWKLWKQKALGR